jgi:hypothetical protein
MKLRLAFIIGILSLAAVSGFAVVIGNSGGGQYTPIETADDNPEVTENGVFRLLASNDVDENETSIHPDIYNVSARNLQMRMAGNNSSQAVIRIDNTTFTTHQARQYARLTDGYRERLDTDTRIPTEDSWQSGSEVTIENAAFIGFEGNQSTPEHSGEDGVVYVEIESEPGQLPARNVEVLQEETDDDEEPGDLYISNSDDIEVYDGEMKNYEELNRQAVNNSFLDTGLDESVVPAAGYGSNTARYNTTKANISGKWHSPTPAVKDHYVGIARISEGAIYDDYWIVNPEGINVTALTDYRAIVPYTASSRYTENAPQCSYQDGNQTKYATPERYEYYSNPTVTNEFMELYHNGSWYDEGEQSHVFPIEDPASGKITPYSTATIEYNHTYGVDYPSECSQEDEETTETVTVTSTIDRNAEHPIEPAKADSLNITAYVKDTRQGQELYFDVVGNQRPEVNPLGSMQITANGGDEVWRVYTPWVVFPQTLYDRVETRREGANQWNFTSVKVGDGPHNLHRDYMDANSYKTAARSTILVSEEGIDQAQTYEGINTGDNVINTKGDIPLYRTWGGRVLSTSTGGRLEDFEANGTDLFGNKIEIDTKFVTYETTDMELEMGSDGEVANGQLVDSNGTGIPNREIHIEGGTTSTVVTDSNGEFQVQVHENATGFVAEFKGDKLRDNVPTHYEQADARTFTGNLNINVISTPLGYLSNFISSLYVVIHWIVLGLFFVWWTKFRNDK